MSSVMGTVRFRNRGLANGAAAVFLSLLITSSMSAGQPADGLFGEAGRIQLSPMSATAVNGVELGGPFSITYSPSAAYDLKAGSICNHGSQSQTGILRVELWAFSQPYTGGAVSGYRLTNANVMSGLEQNQCYSNYDSSTAYPGTNPTPPSGTYYPVLFLSEYESASTNDGFVYDDYALVPSTVSVSNGVITVGAAPRGCTPDSQTLCIDDRPGDQRFQIRASFHTAQGTGQSGIAHPIGLSTLGVNQGGLLWFFSANNPEVVIKVVNGCTLNSRYWVFASAGTNVGVNMTVTDTQTSAVKTYTNPDLTAWAPIQDTAAFPCQ